MSDGDHHTCHHKTALREAEGPLGYTYNVFLFCPYTPQVRRDLTQGTSDKLTTPLRIYDIRAQIFENRAFSHYCVPQYPGGDPPASEVAQYRFTLVVLI